MPTLQYTPGDTTTATLFLEIDVAPRRTKRSFQRHHHHQNPPGGLPDNDTRRISLYPFSFAPRRTAPAPRPSNYIYNLFTSCTSQTVLPAQPVELRPLDRERARLAFALKPTPYRLPDEERGMVPAVISAAKREAEEAEKAAMALQAKQDAAAAAAPAAAASEGVKDGVKAVVAADEQQQQPQQREKRKRDKKEKKDKKDKKDKKEKRQRRGGGDPSSEPTASGGLSGGGGPTDSGNTRVTSG